MFLFSENLVDFVPYVLDKFLEKQLTSTFKSSKIFTSKTQVNQDARKNAGHYLIKERGFNTWLKCYTKAKPKKFSPPPTPTK